MMRRMLKGLIFALALCLMISAAAADAVDLSRMSDAEVVALYEQVAQEIVRRGISRTATLPAGTYIAGEDLPAGRYVFTCLAAGDDWGSLTVYSDRGTGRQLLWHVVAAPEAGEAPQTYYITLNEGDQLKCQVPFSLTVSTGVVFR